MPMTNETSHIVYIHPKGYYAVVERRGKGKLSGEEYCIRETIYPPFLWQKSEPEPKPEPKPKPQPVQTITVISVTEQDKARFAELYEQGHSIRKIAATSGWSETTIYSHLKTMDVPRRKRKVTDSEKTQMKQMAQNGIAVRKIAATMGVSKYTIYKYLYR